MCGIAGIFAFRDRERTWSGEKLDGMINSLRHRGPDGSGRHVEPGLFMGHTRLAVLDLSPAGSQPMFSGDGRYVISYNGEIYNFRQIRKELESSGHSFVSRSDTEVLLAAWQEWGERSIERLDGIFAFGLFDRLERKFFLVRDHLGIKPLFYMIDGDQLIFASEPAAVLRALEQVPPVDERDIDSYFTFNYLPAPRTGIKGLLQLPAACCLAVDASGARQRRYWKPEYNPEPEAWNEQLLEKFKELLAESVKSQTVSDAPVGLFLSGGLDSYAVARAAVSEGFSPTAFTLGFREKRFDETDAARTYADHLHIKSEVEQFAWTEEDLLRVLGSMGELLADSSCFPVYQLSRFARKNVTVILAGDGGDELLAGYDTYRAGELTPYVRALPRFIRRSVIAAAQCLPSDNERYGARMIVERMISASEEGHGRDHASFRRIFDRGMKRRLYTSGFAKAVGEFDAVGEYAGLMAEVPEARSYLTARQHADLLFHLPSILAKVDRMSMANGLEVRVPLLSRKMVEFCINLPDAAKRYRGRGKRILRDALSGAVPAGALKRRKAGFLPPVDKWFRTPGPVMNVFDDYLGKARQHLGILDWAEVRKLWHDHRAKKTESGFVLLGILQFINWSERCRNPI